MASFFNSLGLFNSGPHRFGHRAIGELVVPNAVLNPVQPGSIVSATFELVRHSAKLEAPLAGLAQSIGLIYSTVADVTFFGHDQAGNDLSVTGSIGVQFGNFADPEN